MSPKLLRRLLLVSVLSASPATARAQLLGNDTGPVVGAPVHPIDQAIDGVAHVFDGDWIDPPCPVAKHRIWGSAEYMVTWLSGNQLPPLITAGPAGAPFGAAAVLGAPGTRTVFGGGNTSDNPYSGARITIGAWLSEHYDRGAEVSGFVLGNRIASAGAIGTGAADSVAVGRPIIVGGQETVGYSAFANALSGGSFASLSTDYWGIEANGLWRERLIGTTFITFLGGVRYLDLQQDLEIQDRTTPQGFASVPFAGVLAINNPNIASVTDSYQTHNQFIGGQLGFRTNTEFKRFDLGLGAKIAVGGTMQTVGINGYSQVLASNGQAILTTPGGVLANPGNMGRFSREAFSAVPELEAKLAFRCTDYLSIFVSYDYLYWTRVANPGSQVSREVNLANVPTSGLYAFTPGLLGRANIQSSNFTANSIMFGATIKY